MSSKSMSRYESIIYTGSFDDVDSIKKVEYDKASKIIKQLKKSR